MRSKEIAAFIVLGIGFFMGGTALADDDRVGVGAYCKDLADQLPDIVTRDTFVLCNSVATHDNQEAVCICKEWRNAGILEFFADNLGQCIMFLNNTSD